MNNNNHIGIALEELYRIFSILNKNYFADTLPVPMLTVQKTRSSNVLGWFTLDEVWEHKEDSETKKYEINLCPEHLSRDVNEIVGTLHHEMVHYSNKISGVKDCNGQIHNKKFKKLAEAVGLIVERSKKYGFGHTTCSEDLEKYIQETIQPKEECFSYFRQLPMKPERKVTQKRQFKYVCPNCNETVKAKEGKNIICGDCEVSFELVL